jgi:uroporphyrinogen-III decarboxylase
MTAKERLLAALRGQPTDHVPIYTQIPFVVTAQGFKPGPIHGYADRDPWREQDAAYWRLVRRMEAECDNFYFWRPPCMGSDQLFVPPALTETLPPVERDGRLHSTQVMRWAGRELRATSAVQPGTGHSWQIEHWCKSPEDAYLLLDAPWQGYPPALADLPDLQRNLGERGVMWVTIPSPLLPVARLFDPTEFLLYVRTEHDLVQRLMALAAQRIRANLEALLDLGAGPIIRFGGAEHATPPMMSPRDFDELVVAYDQPLMALCRQRRRMVAVHCHGHLRHALQRFVEMGVDQTDPCETLPDGDVTPAEARAIAGDQITLTGNIQMRELFNEDAAYIRRRVRQIIQQAGPRRLVITTTGTPLEAIPRHVEANYNAMIDAVMEYGAL